MHPELYSIEDRDEVTFDEFCGYDRYIEKFEESPASFKESDNKFFFFDSFTYDLLFKQTEGKNISKERVESVLGKELYKDFVKARSC